MAISHPLYPKDGFVLDGTDKDPISTRAYVEYSIGS